MLLQIMAVLSIILFLGVIFTVCGEWLYCKAVSEGCSHPVSFRIGAGYFFGMAFFETLWKLIAYISGNAKLTFAVTVFIMILIALIKVKSLLPVLSTYFRSIDGRWIVKMALILFLIVSVYVLKVFLKMEPFNAENFSILSHLGSMHSGRYANIATFISESNYIPVLNQNIGQSMLASVPLILGFNSPFLALNLWLSTSIIFIYLAFYGLFIMLGLNNIMSLFGSILLIIGNTALSLFAINLLDSGSPIFLTGYTDTIFSVGSFIGFLILLKNFYDDQINSALFFSIAAAILCVSWSFSAPQNIVLSSILVTLIAGIMLVNKKFTRKHRLLYAFMVISVMTGIIQGGMLTPRQLCDNTKIPGVMFMSGDDNNSDKSTRFRFEFPYSHKGGYYGMFYKEREMYKPLEIYREVSMLPQYSVYDMFYELCYEIEIDFFNSLRITFFPLLGLVLPWFIGGFRKGSPESEPSNIKKLWFVSFVLFLVGYLIVFCIQFNGFKWELSRFMILGYAIATISFITSLNILLKQISHRKSLLIISVVIFVMTFDQIVLVVSEVRKNVYYSGSNKVLPFFERFKMLVDLHGMQGAPKSR